MMGAMEVIYLDELFAVNALIDALLLRLAAYAAGLPLRLGRLLGAALLGGAYAVLCALLPGSPLPAVAGKLGAAALICAAAFGVGKSFWRGWAAFLGVSALFAGAVFAAALLAGRKVGPGSVAARVSLRLLGLSFGACYAGVRLFRSRWPAGREIVPAQLRVGERRAALSVLRDTGNSLTDPVSGCPILVADPRALEPLLCFSLPDAIPDAPALLELLSADPLLRPRLGLAPYAAVGVRGLLLTLRPDELLLDGTPVRALAGLSPTPVGDGTYNAVF